ncbi:MAG: dephospho-CoA kinase [Planctomycetota bacterium]|nr:dephospho-CoA kinase [Planctomycetota bacterium]
MLVIGLIGTVCSGKSTVARVFEEAGAEVFSADEEVARLYERDEVRRRVREEFGDSVFTLEGKVNRAALARRVFPDPAELRKLTEGIIYPPVRAEMEKRVRAAREGRLASKALVLDAPTLVEAGCARLCDRLVFVTAPIARRRAWAAASRGWEEGEIERREALMTGEEEKRKLADATIENASGLDDLKAAAMDVWRRLTDAAR